MSKLSPLFFPVPISFRLLVHTLPTYHFPVSAVISIFLLQYLFVQEPCFPLQCSILVCFPVSPALFLITFPGFSVLNSFRAQSYTSSLLYLPHLLFYFISSCSSKYPLHTDDSQTVSAAHTSATSPEPGALLPPHGSTWMLMAWQDQAPDLSPFPPLFPISENGNNFLVVSPDSLNSSFIHNLPSTHGNLLTVPLPNPHSPACLASSSVMIFPCNRCLSFGLLQ